jgi:hypothetical protein
VETITALVWAVELSLLSLPESIIPSWNLMLYNGLILKCRKGFLTQSVLWQKQKVTYVTDHGAGHLNRLSELVTEVGEKRYAGNPRGYYLPIKKHW